MVVESLIRQLASTTRRTTLARLFASVDSSFKAVLSVFNGDAVPYLLANVTHAEIDFLSEASVSKVVTNQNHIHGDQDDGLGDAAAVVWMAAPKKRTSRRTKWLRHQRKFIKNREDIEMCDVCGNAKLMNHLCGTCFDRIQKESQAVLKELKSQPGFWRPALPKNLKQLNSTKACE